MSCMTVTNREEEKEEKDHLPWPRQKQLFLYESKEAIKQDVACQTSLMFNIC